MTLILGVYLRAMFPTNSSCALPKQAKIILYTEVIHSPDYVALQPGEFASQLANDENG